MSAGIVLLFLSIGLIGGYIGGMLGVGGGILFVPCLHYGFQTMGVKPALSFQAAVATSLAIILLTALSAAISHTRHGSLEPRSVVIMGLMAIPAAFLGSAVGVLLGGAILKRAFGVLTLFVAYQFLRPIPVRHEKADRTLQTQDLIMVGGVSGLLSSIFGVGGGIITVPLLHLVLDVPMRRAVANSSGLIVFSALSGTIGWIIAGRGVEGRPLYSMGFVNLLAWLLISITAMTAAQFGATMANRIPSHRLRFPFGILLGCVGINMGFF